MKPVLRQAASCARFLAAASVWAALAACGGGPAQKGLTGPQEAAFRDTADRLAQPGTGSMLQDMFAGDQAAWVVETYGPEAYRDLRLRHGKAARLVRLQQIIDDVERAVARTGPASDAALEIARSDHQRLASLAAGAAAEAVPATGSDALARAKANQQALRKALAHVKLWQKAFHLTAEEIVFLENESDESAVLLAALGRYAMAVNRLESAKSMLDLSIAALSDGAKMPSEPKAFSSRISAADHRPRAYVP